MRHAYKIIETGKVNFMNVLSGDPQETLKEAFGEGNFEYLGVVEDKIIDGSIDMTKKHALVADENGVISTDQALDDKEILRLAKEAIAVKGAAKKVLADKILSIIAGHNEENGLDATQIASIKADHPVVMELLTTGMPMTAKPLIEAITPDGTIITQEELDHVALEYEEFEAANI